jgi:hypothetical protein
LSPFIGLKTSGLAADAATDCPTVIESTEAVLLIFQVFSASPEFAYLCANHLL